MKRRSQIDLGAATDPFELMTAHNVIPPPISNQIANDAFSRRSLARAHFSPRDLRVAASNGDLALVNSYILSKPEYLDRKDKSGWSALHMAVKGGHVPVVVYLLEAGAEFNAATNDNKLALSIAVERWGDDHAIPNLLRTAGAKLPHEAREEGGYDTYIEEGRSRLDRLLGSFDDDDNVGGRDEL
jgi:ankyrin repeat protein